jgi:hypothetical protein
MAGMRGFLVIGLFLAGCEGNHHPGESVDSAPGDPTLSYDHPGDVGMGEDPDVVWFEDFEQADVGAVASRYDQVQGMPRMALITDAPAGHALALTAGGGVDAVDLYKQLPDHDNVYVRWYAKYDASVPWHHSGMWFGGYNPAMPFPSPNAGNKPSGDDRFSISIEPVWDVGTAKARFDFYNYWSTMRSWMETPTNDGTSYYGNSLVHQKAFTIDEGQWVCLEVHVDVAGKALEVYKNDALVQGLPVSGQWVRDKYCPMAADGSECTDYTTPPFTELVDLTFRTTPSYGVNAFWPQNYITDAAMGTLRFDQMVVATRRIGCMR